jgi:hypothetical protein
MGWTPQMQRDFIVKDLGPMLQQNSLGDVKIMILDDSRLQLPYWAEQVLVLVLTKLIILILLLQGFFSTSNGKENVATILLLFILVCLGLLIN